MKTNYVSEVVRRYFSGDYPPPMHGELQAWMIHNDGKAALKEEALQSLWNEVKPSNDKHVYESLRKMKLRLGMNPVILHQQPTRYRMRRSSMRWAIATLFLLCIAGGWWYHLSNRTEWVDISTHYGQKTFCLLPDSTSVWVNAGSSLRYPKAFRGKTRQVHLSGEAWFAVTKDTGKPFIVSTRTCNVEVMGTQFNVSDYQENHQTVVQLEEGKVEVTLKNDKTYTLAPGQQMIMDKQTNKRFIAPIVSRSSHWKEDELVFEEVPLHDIIQALKRHYNLSIIYQDFHPSADRYSIRFAKGGTAVQALELLRELTESFDWSEKNNQIILQPCHK